MGEEKRRRRVERGEQGGEDIGNVWMGEEKRGGVEE